jgi:hypothetical protein
MMMMMMHKPSWLQSMDIVMVTILMHVLGGFGVEGGHSSGASSPGTVPAVCTMIIT